MLRILHVGLGPLGQRIQRDLMLRRAAKTVAAIDLGPAIGGRPMSELVENADPALRVESSLESIRDWKAIDVAIVTTSSTLARCSDVFRVLLERGLAVVSTCEELLYPWLANRELADQLDRLAKANGGRLLGTGINPGFLMDALPLFGSSVMQRVDAVRVQRLQDATSRRIPFQRKIGAGLSIAEFDERVEAGTLRHVGLPESLHFLAHYLGIPFDGWKESIEPIIAERELSSSLGPIAKGRVAGVHQTAIAKQGARAVIELEFKAAIGLASPIDRVVLDGEPRVEIAIPGGVQGDIGTSAIVINALAPLHRAPAGLHTMATIPSVFCARS